MGMGRLRTKLPPLSPWTTAALWGARATRGKASPTTPIRTNGRMGHSIGSDRAQPNQLAGAQLLGRMLGLDLSLGRSVGDRLTGGEIWGLWGALGALGALAPGESHSRMLLYAAGWNGQSNVKVQSWFDGSGGV